MLITCAHCSKQTERSAGHVNRSRKIGMRLFCNRTCAGLARRLAVPKTKAQKVEEKRLYDIAYRQKNALALKDRKRAYFRKTYDPALAAVKRKERMPLHVAYCRRPEYRAYKQRYDAEHRARKLFGEFADAALLLTEVEKEIGARASNYEIRLTNGTLNKALHRKRDYERTLRG